MRRLLSSLGIDERAAAAVEMGIVAPVLAAVIVGLVDISSAVRTKVQLEQAAQRSVELAQRSNYSSSMNSTLQSEAETAAGTGSTATVTAWLECNHGTQLNYDTGSCSAGQSYARYVRVVVTKPFTPMFGTRFFSRHNANGTVTVEGRAMVRVQ